jgi:hypothetical protein
MIATGSGCLRAVSRPKIDGSPGRITRRYAPRPFGVALRAIKFAGGQFVEPSCCPSAVRITAAQQAVPEIGFQAKKLLAPRDGYKTLEIIGFYRAGTDQMQKYPLNYPQLWVGLIAAQALVRRATHLTHNAVDSAMFHGPDVMLS